MSKERTSGYRIQEGKRWPTPSRKRREKRRGQGAASLLSHHHYNIETVVQGSPAPQFIQIQGEAQKLDWQLRIQWSKRRATQLGAA